MHKKLKVLDLFCGAGGASIGFRHAGFDVIVGIDNRPQKNYPFDFILADALRPPVNLLDFDFIWASPPCQRYSFSGKFKGNDWQRHLDLIPPTRKLLKQHPFTTIENVPGAPLRTTFVLTGPTVGLPYIQRRRHFENSFLMWQPLLKHVPKEYFKKGLAITVTKSMCSSSHWYARKAIGLRGRPYHWEVKWVMGIPLLQKMTYAELGEAVPPPYAEFIAREAIRQMR